MAFALFQVFHILGYFSVSPNYKYLYYALRNTRIPNTGYNRHFKWLKETSIPYTSADTQAEIVHVLDGMTSIIQKRQQQLSAFDELIKARFVEMFGDCKTIISASSFMSDLRNGVSPSTSGRIHAKVLTLSAITQGRFDSDMWKDGLFEEDPLTDKRILASDFYMCRGNGNRKLVGAGVYSAMDREDLVFPDTVIAAHIDSSQVSLPYLFVAWMQPMIREQIEAGARTTNGTYKINQKIISNIKVPIPSIELQSQFAAFVAQIDKSKYVILWIVLVLQSRQTQSLSFASNIHNRRKI